MILSVHDLRVVHAIQKVYFNGEDITNVCFECCIDFDDPTNGWAKVYLRDENQRFKIGGDQRPMWKLIHGKITTEPEATQLREILRKAGVDVSSAPTIP